MVQIAEPKHGPAGLLRFLPHAGGLHAAAQDYRKAVKSDQFGCRLREWLFTTIIGGRMKSQRLVKLIIGVCVGVLAWQIVLEN
jgi:hypothetical protein